MDIKLKLWEFGMKERRDVKQLEWRIVVTLDLLLRSWTKNATTSCLPTAWACEE